MTGLRGLVEKATPGPWAVGFEDDREAYVFSRDSGSGWVTHRPEPWMEGGILDADARLIALAPDLALWAADAADHLRKRSDNLDDCRCRTCRDAAALLARFAVIQARAQEEQT